MKNKEKPHIKKMQLSYWKGVYVWAYFENQRAKRPTILAANVRTITYALHKRTSRRLLRTK